MAYVYTESELAEVISAYNNGTSLEVLAEKYNKSVASVRMKLVKQGVYKKAVIVKASSALPSTKSQGFPTTKGEILALYTRCLDSVGPAPY